MEQKLSTTAKALQAAFGGRARRRIALETGTHSPWISRVLGELGHEVIVANAQLSGRLQRIFLEDFRKEPNEIQSLVARRLFVLAKLVHLTHLRIGEYMALVAAADASGHYGVGVLLESSLADKLALLNGHGV